MAEYILEMNHIVKEFSGVRALDDVNFKVRQGEIMANAIAVYDKFTPIGWDLNQRILADFQLIDYTLLAGSIHFDAVAGISNQTSKQQQ